MLKLKFLVDPNVLRASVIITTGTSASLPTRYADIATKCDRNLVKFRAANVVHTY